MPSRRKWWRGVSYVWNQVRRRHKTRVPTVEMRIGLMRVSMVTGAPVVATSVSVMSANTRVSASGNHRHSINGVETEITLPPSPSPRSPMQMCSPPPDPVSFVQTLRGSLIPRHPEARALARISPVPWAEGSCWFPRDSFNFPHGAMPRGRMPPSCARGADNVEGGLPDHVITL